MPCRHLDLVAHWRIAAPVEPVWAALADAESWPRWWPGVRAVRMLRAGDAQGVGRLCRIEWTTPLAGALVVELESVEALPGERLRGRSRGPLRGEGIWLLRGEAGHTDVTCVWRAEPARRWTRWLAPLLAPVWRRIHRGVMRAGHAGLSSYLRGTPARTA